MLLVFDLLLDIFMYWTGFSFSAFALSLSIYSLYILICPIFLSSFSQTTHINTHCCLPDITDQQYLLNKSVNLNSQVFSDQNIVNICRPGYLYVWKYLPVWLHLMSLVWSESYLLCLLDWPLGTAAG